jgi:hypothetical protein
MKGTGLIEKQQGKKGEQFFAIDKPEKRRGN